MDYFNAYGFCELCPRRCKANRLSNQRGYCKIGNELAIASIVRHRGEEPPISGPNGIANVFFMHCNLQCVYCQNRQISRNACSTREFEYSLEEACTEIASLIEDGCGAVGFVSPTHYIPHVKAMITLLRDWGIEVPFIYNTNGYELAERIRELSDFIDVWLPDYKYADAQLAQIYSGAKDYPERVLEALKEMYRQKGSTLIINDKGYATSGIIIRHLVLPGHIKNSLKVLESIAWELSTNVHISLMSQYNPGWYNGDVANMKRIVYQKEYNEVVEAFHELGFHKGWIQEAESFDFYNPNFNRDHPFE